jgi:gamma-glutamyltranspeptidase/glutathione hydrolase
MGFGSGIVIPGRGISMQNRGCGFSLVPGHPNQAAPARRPFHTIIPGYLERGDGERMAFGCMGGPMQPQGHVQMVTALVDHDLDPQAVCAMPRFRVLDGVEIALEDGIPASTRERLSELGHAISPRPGPWAFGGAQIATIRPGGEIVTGTDPRKDGFQAVSPRSVC